MLERFQKYFVDQLKTEHASHASQIWIHKNNWQSSLQTTLMQDFPYLVKLLGESYFKSLTWQYLRLHPSRAPDLGRFRVHFPDFIVAQPFIHDYPYLADVAYFEEYCSGLIQRIAQPFPWHKLQTIKSDDYGYLCFSKNDHCALLRCNYPILELLAFCDQTSHHQDFIIQPRNSYLLLVAYDERIKILSLTFQEFVFLEKLFNGSTISTALDAISPDDANETLPPIHYNFLSNKLPRWLADNIFCDCYLFKAAL